MSGAPSTGRGPNRLDLKAHANPVPRGCRRYSIGELGQQAMSEAEHCAGRERCADEVLGASGAVRQLTQTDDTRMGWMRRLFRAQRRRRAYRSIVNWLRVGCLNGADGLASERRHITESA